MVWEDGGGNLASYPITLPRQWRFGPTGREPLQSGLAGHGAAFSGDPGIASMHYIDSLTGASYPLEQPRWRGESGGHVNLGDAPGLTRADIDASVHSLWRYRKALLVDAA
ncbi:MAG: hypothetical protein ACRD3I_12375, partial [Terriglobales bacterium]